MEIAKILLENGADPRRPDKDKWSCMHECIEKENLEFAMLIYKGIQDYNRRYKQRVILLKQKMDENLSLIPNFSIEMQYSIDSKYIPLVGRLAPSDRFYIVKYGKQVKWTNTFAGYDGFSILRRNIHTIYNPTNLNAQLKELPIL